MATVLKQTSILNTYGVARAASIIALLAMSVGCTDASPAKPSPTDTIGASEAPVSAGAEDSLSVQVTSAPDHEELTEAAALAGVEATNDSDVSLSQAAVEEVATDSKSALVQANWPGDIPLPKWLAGAAAISIANGVSLRASGEADYLQNVSFFRDELQAAGWTLEAEEQPTPVIDSLRFSKDNRVVSVVVVAVVGGINVQLSQQILAADQT